MNFIFRQVFCFLLFGFNICSYTETRCALMRCLNSCVLLRSSSLRQLLVLFMILIYFLNDGHDLLHIFLTFATTE